MGFFMANALGVVCVLWFATAVIAGDLGGIALSCLGIYVANRDANECKKVKR